MTVKNLYITWQKLNDTSIGCLIMNNDTNEIIGNGESMCSKDDTFNKNMGRKIATARAIKAAEIPKEVRKEIWETYRTMTKVPRW